MFELIDVSFTVRSLKRKYFPQESRNATRSVEIETRFVATEQSIIRERNFPRVLRNLGYECQDQDEVLFVGKFHVRGHGLTKRLRIAVKRW